MKTWPVQDAKALSRAISDVRARRGPIAALGRGAGVIADRRIEDLTDEQFQFVYSTKAIRKAFLVFVKTVCNPLIMNPCNAFNYTARSVRSYSRVLGSAAIDFRTAASGWWR